MILLENRNILIDGMKEIGIELTDQSLQKLLAYKGILLDWNEKINLTAITEEKDVYIKHFVDSATCLKTGYIKDGMALIDVGTGAGFPGVPIKILSQKVHMTLLDSLNKRITYLHEVIEKLGLQDVEPIHGRAEEVGVNSKYREKYDIALSRAVAAMNVLCEYCLPFVKVGGYFICQKGSDCKEELKEAEKAIKLLGGQLVETQIFKLPFSDITHQIIIIKKVAETPTKYPRKPGKPAANPII